MGVPPVPFTVLVLSEGFVPAFKASSLVAILVFSCSISLGLFSITFSGKQRKASWWGAEHGYVVTQVAVCKRNYIRKIFVHFFRLVLAFHLHQVQQGLSEQTLETMSKPLEQIIDKVLQTANADVDITSLHLLSTALPD